jgi:hypothetical protein
MATKNKPTSNRLSEIIAYKRSQGGSVTGSLAGGIKERLKEKFDPRQLVNQRGLLAALFPGLKAYQAKTSAKELSSSSLQRTSFDEIKPILETISFNTKVTAKNTMVLPALHRDVNVIRQNMVKLVKMKGGDARTKADMYFVKAKDREDKYERELKKERNKSRELSNLKDGEKDDKKGLLGTILSSIVKGIKLIINSIVTLGKAIIGTFQLLGELLINVISSAVGFLMDTILGLAGFLKTGLGLALEVFFGKKILEFFKGAGLGFRILTSLGTSIIGWLFSRLGLTRLAMGILPYALPVIAAALGAKIIDEFYSNEDPLENFNFLNKLKDESNTVFPTSDRRGGGTPEKPLIQRGKTGKMYESMDRPDNLAAKFLNKKTLSEIYNIEGNQKRKSVMAPYPYEVAIPGIKDPQLLYMTKEQATSWGDKREQYLELLEKYLKLKKHTAAVGPEAEKRRSEELSNYSSRLMELQDSMLNDVDKIAKDTLAPQYYETLKNQIERAKLRQYDPNVLAGISNKIWKATGIEEAVQKEVDALENQGKTVAGNALNFVTEKGTEFKNVITESANAARKSFSEKILEMTQQNKGITSEVSEPVVIINNSQQKKGQPPFSPKPASVWNENFISDYYDELLVTPWYKNVK